MCMRSTLCSGDRHTTGIPTKSAEDTNLGSYSVQHFTSPLHDYRRATTPRQQGDLRLTHLQCSQFTWSRNQGSVTTNHAADSVTFAYRVRNSMSRPPSIIQDTVTCCTFIDRFVTTSVIPLIVRTSRFTLLKIFLPATHLTICLFARRPRFFVARRTVTDLSLPFASVQHVLFCRNSPLCLLQNFLQDCLRLPRGVLRQAICNLISRIEPPQVSFTGHCLSLDYGQLNCQSLVC